VCRENKNKGKREEMRNLAGCKKSLGRTCLVFDGKQIEESKNAIKNKRKGKGKTV
jgi:hypothetical protein